MKNAKKKLSDNIQILPRGGILAKTSAGLIQVGATPETIKDSIIKEGDAPQIYLIPKNLFSFERNISNADFEFPIYYNFFIKNRKAVILGKKEQLNKIYTVVKEAFIGPSRLKIEKDYLHGKIDPAIANLYRETSFFRFSGLLGRCVNMEDIVEFINLSPGESFLINNVVISNSDENNYSIKDGAKEFLLPKNFIFSELQKKEFPPEPFLPPLFGVTIIGSGHGFDPLEKTTGFILWINRKGILVDPPVNTTEWMEENNINKKLINDLILTHCHADHDSGTLQKIFEERKINLHTTETIKASFVRKYSELTGIMPKDFKKLFNFKQILIGNLHEINNGKIIFKYSFHSIPTIWFEVFFHDKTFVYTSDMLNHPDTINELINKKIMSKKRGEEFLKFPWNHSLIIHEAGVPPIHTPVTFLEGLPDEIKKHLYLIHISEKHIPENKGLNLAKSGVENTLICPVNNCNECPEEEKIDLISGVDIFQDIDLKKIRNIINKTYYKEFKKGETIIKKGDRGDDFFIIQSGEALISIDGKISKTFSNYDYFGETSIIFDITRNADVIANTHLKLLVIEKGDLLYLINDTAVIEKARHLAIIRDLASWEVLNENPVFKNLSATQKNELQFIMNYKIYKGKELLIKKGRKAQYGYLIKSGLIDIYRDERHIYEAKRGDFLARIDFKSIYHKYNSDAYSRVVAEVFVINLSDLKKLMDKNPGIKIKLIKLNPLNNIL